MRAIDLYAGIGGWAFGLKMAGIDVVASYEIWKPAIQTHSLNHGKEFQPTDIRNLDLDSLPAGIDMVVGSPPCTQFSYANRGGSGDIADGTKDLICFFEVVERLNPRFWAFENVPRVAKVIEAAFDDPEHPLYRFRELPHQIRVFDFSEFGTPQARKRCIVSNIPFDLVDGYKTKLPRRSLGDVLEALSSPGQVTDPVWGMTLPAEKVSDTQTEPALNPEELRMNREAKEFHPVYNNMTFPESIEEPARTVTATCTRVSRESLIIEDPLEPERFRRLSIRERAMLQGFPITYQFLANSFAEKAKMVGNAIPPTLPYLLGCAAKEVSPEQFQPFAIVGSKAALPKKMGTSTPPDAEGKTYRLDRKFRAALPGLRFKSGMRFELSNAVHGGDARWQVSFFYGSSKEIREIELDGEVTHDLQDTEWYLRGVNRLARQFAETASTIEGTTPDQLQNVWSHQSDGLHPYEVVDALGNLASHVKAAFEDALSEAEPDELEDYIAFLAGGEFAESNFAGKNKLKRHALDVMTGIIVGDWFNCLGWHQRQRMAA